ncbi:MAG: ABC transporter, permease protein 2 (cluster 1, maltose/g3p/polyamine/iron) [uncultured Thermomicrobiales bacterium]|uniref:ABC transporter, permease protein 2 (Cluster 1, maltose/g3p/polyamine/iron) n=1 Tax=uncultured Thermomicrobiales bacterium TaxID=1645740 RepID=A0A6J4U666_9BACT|nr:MAG: ABC transporter, permease protein 2 (cluster 1, maltose/g3p/polyamine/iron) [uncultured Thermomicrobiales bacterium]
MASTPVFPTQTERGTYRSSRKVQARVLEGVTHVILILGALTMIVPFLWMISTSLKDFGQVFIIPPSWIPNPIQWGNYPDSLNALPFARAYWNSTYIAVVVVASQLLTCSMAGYAFARIPFPFRNQLFIVFLATLMIPQQVTIIPTFIIMRNLGLIDNHLSLIIPSALFNAFGVFLLRQFIMGLPQELEESAVLDGANRLRIYWQIILPLIKAPLAALGIFSFLGQWNNLFTANIFLSSPDNYTVPLLLNQFKGLYITDWTLMMAAATIAVVPVLLVYLVGQRYIIEGVALTGIKR